MDFKKEREFEDAIVELLVTQMGWSDGILNQPTEEDLIQNWAEILFKTNNEVDRLNGVPLNQGEINQLMAQIGSLQTPNERNNFINDKTVIITRENEADTLHYGKEVSLKIFDRDEIAGGSSIYQIARQPRFAKGDPIERDRRGDFMLLINGIPMIHVELKRSGVPLSKVVYQIKTYLHENKFRGLYSLVQIFVAMTPEDMRYFANPGRADRMNEDYHFYWAGKDNVPRGDWKSVSSEFLSIPMAHQLIGYYTIADSKDGILKAMRSYQIYATKQIVDRVREKQANDWVIKDQLGGYIWHTTGSGKTMTSFKSAELLAQLKYADKVVFLVDRIALATQTVSEFEGFSHFEDIYATENTDALVEILDNDTVGRLIITSIQKMSKVVDGELDEKKLEDIKDKRIVFIVDEAHRSTFGSMMMEIKSTYRNAMFFGFTGTPIQVRGEEDSTQLTTADIFGDCLHKYTLADGIRDGNVLGFDVTKVETIPEKEFRKTYALHEAGVQDLSELQGNDRAYELYEYYMDPKNQPTEKTEKKLGNRPYEKIEHREKVVEDILNSWVEMNHNNRFSAIFATNSIQEAIEYWRLLKNNKLNLKVTSIFDASDDFSEFSIEKNDGLKDIIKHYNDMYGKNFTIARHDAFKADVANRLAQKGEYRNTYSDDEEAFEEKLDIVIVVHQLLTGYDSKWVSMLFVDQVLEMHNLIQAFSRTNRLNGPEKPHGSIKYYRRPATMEKNIEEAVREYSADQPGIMFVDKLPANVKKINECFENIRSVFESSGIRDFSEVPKELGAQKKFVDEFNKLNQALESALMQGFRWDKRKYKLPIKGAGTKVVELVMREKDYNTLLIRYQELLDGPPGPPPPPPPPEIDLDFNYHIVEKNYKIDLEYINELFKRYVGWIRDKKVPREELEALKASLHKNFASLPKERQVFAEMIINDLEAGRLVIHEDWDFNDYINEYSVSELDRQIQSVAEFTGIDGEKLRDLLRIKLDKSNLNEFGRFDQLKDSVNLELLMANLSEFKGKKVSVGGARIYANKMLKAFLLEDTFYIQDYNESNREEL